MPGAGRYFFGDSEKEPRGLQDFSARHYAGGEGVGPEGLSKFLKVPHFRRFYVAVRPSSHVGHPRVNMLSFRVSVSPRTWN